MIVNRTMQTYYLVPASMQVFVIQIVFSVGSLVLGLWSRTSDDTPSKEQKLYASLILYLVSIGFFLVWLSAIFTFT